MNRDGEFMAGLTVGAIISAVLIILAAMAITVSDLTHYELCKETLTYIEAENQAEWLLEHPSCLEVINTYD